MGKEFEEILRRQNQLFTMAQAIASGISKRQVLRRADNTWPRVFHGVYTTQITPLTFEQKCRGALLACGPGYAIAHRSALALHGIWTLPTPWFTDDRIHLVAPADVARHHSAPDGIVVHRARSLTSNDLAFAAGLPCVNHPYALISMVNDAPRAEIVIAYEHFIRKGMGGWLKRRMAQLNDGRDLALLHELIDRTASRNVTCVDSPLEAYADDVCCCAGMPPVRQIPIALGNGITVHGDLAWPRLFVVMEIDGEDAHNNGVMFYRDRGRDVLLAEQGWVCLRKTAPDLRDREGLALSLFRVLLTQAQLLGVDLILSAATEPVYPFALPG